MDVNIDLCTIFNSMTPEKQRETAAKLVHDQLNGSSMKTIVVAPEIDEDGSFDPDGEPTARGLNMQAVVDDLGEEGAIDLMMSMLKSGAITTKILDGEAIKELLKKCDAGKATPEEYAMARGVLLDALERDASRIDIGIVITKTLLDLMEFHKEHHHMKMSYYEILSSVFMILLGSMINTEKTPMYQFKDADPQQCINAAVTVSRDIDECLHKDLFKDGEPNHQFTVLGLLYLAQQYICKMNPEESTFVDPKILEKMFGLDQIFKDDEEKTEDEN